MHGSISLVISVTAIYDDVYLFPRTPFPMMRAHQRMFRLQLNYAFSLQ